MKTFTAATVRRIAKTAGLAHAEVCLEDAILQLGSAKCAAAKAELNRLMKAEMNRLMNKAAKA